MDSRFGATTDLDLTVQGIEIFRSSQFASSDVSTAHLTEAVRSILKDKKSLKFMSKQDMLATLVATNLKNKYGENFTATAERTGLYICVGTLAFEKNPILKIAETASEDGQLSMKKFTNEAYVAINPLQTFKTLPSMPAFHVSYQLGIKGHYFISYPGPIQWANVLLQADLDLKRGVIDQALVIGVCDQSNFLTQELHRRLGYADGYSEDAATAMLLSSSKVTTQGLLSFKSIKFQSKVDLDILGDCLFYPPENCCNPGIQLEQILSQKSEGVFHCHVRDYLGLEFMLEGNIP